MLGMFGYLLLKHVLAIGFFEKKKRFIKFSFKNIFGQSQTMVKKIENTHNDLVV